MKIITIMFLLMFGIIGCSSTISYCTDSVKSPMQHTGIVTIVDISVGECDMQKKGGSPTCDRTITYRDSRGAFRTLGLVRSDQWPPVWKGAVGDIWFWNPLDINCIPSQNGVVISEFDLWGK